MTLQDIRNLKAAERAKQEEVVRLATAKLPPDVLEQVRFDIVGGKLQICKRSAPWEFETHSSLKTTGDT